MRILRKEQFTNVEKLITFRANVECLLFRILSRDKPSEEEPLK